MSKLKLISPSSTASVKKAHVRVHWELLEEGEILAFFLN